MAADQGVASKIANTEAFAMRRTFVLASLLLLPLTALAAPNLLPRIPVELFATLPENVRHPEGLTVDPGTGEVFVGTFDTREPAESRNNRVLRYSREGELLATRAFGPTPLTGLAYFDGHVYVLNFGASKLQRLPARFRHDSGVEDIVRFAALDPPVPTARSVANPDGSVDRISFGSNGVPGINGMAFDRDGNLFVSDSFQGAIYRIDRANRCSPCTVRVISRDPLLGTAGSPPFGANGLAFNAKQDRLFVANAGDGRLLSMSPSGVSTRVVAENLHGADGLIFHEGMLWLAANQADTVLGLDQRGRIRAQAGEFEGLDEQGRPRSLLFPATPAAYGDWILVTNLSLPLTDAKGDEWEEDIKRWTVSRFKLPKSVSLPTQGAVP